MHFDLPLCISGHSFDGFRFTLPILRLTKPYFLIWNYAIDQLSTLQGEGRNLLFYGELGGAETEIVD